MHRYKLYSSGFRVVVLLVTFFLGSKGTICRAADPDYRDANGPDDQTGFEIALETTQKDLLAQIESVEKTLEKLPPFNPSYQANRFGYHSDYLPVLSGSDGRTPEKPRWTIQFSFASGSGKDVSLSGIALVPALVVRDGKLRPYGFPKRFRIIGASMSNATERILVDWVDTPFSDPGSYPAYFTRLDAAEFDTFRLEVFEGMKEEDVEFFALGEIVRFIDRPWRARNQTYWFDKQKASGLLNQEPYWSLDYVFDEQMSLGPPLGEAVDENSDLIIEYPPELPPKPVELFFKLDYAAMVGRLFLYPASWGDKAGVPGYGFPTSLEVELYSGWDEESQFPYGMIRRHAESRLEHSGKNRVVINLAPNVQNVRGIKLTIQDIPVHEGKAVLALGEIEFMSHGRIVGKLVRARGFPPEEENQLNCLMDGTVQGRIIIREWPWLRGLAHRKLLERSLGQMVHTRDAALERKRHNWGVAGMIVGTLVLTFLTCWLIYQSVAARRKESRLRNQLASDLHDDVGALLGCTMLAGKKLEQRVTDEKSLHEVGRILNSTTKATQGLRDIVWLTNQEQDTLQHLIAKLNETAQIYSDYYTITFSAAKLTQLAKTQLSLAGKRDIFLVVKEALNNIHKHAQAERIELSLSLSDGRFRVCVKDDGTGFDLNAVHADDRVGFGLKSMANRARHLGGTLTIDSEPGSGTEVVLEFPVKKVKNIKISDDNYG